MSEGNRALQDNFKGKEYALSRARMNFIRAKVGVKAAEATLEKLSKNGADPSVRDKAAEDLIQAIKMRDAVEAAISQAKAEWISSQATFNASNLGKQLKAEKEKTLRLYSQYKTRRAREQNNFMNPNKSNTKAPQGGSRLRSKKRKSVKINRKV